MSNEVTPTVSVVSAASAVFGWLPKLASGVVGLTALAYIFGWRWSAAYYGELGAPWAAHLLSVQQVTQSASWFVAVAAFVALLSTAGVISGHSTSRSLRNWSIVYFLLALILYFWFDKSWGWFHSKYSPLLQVSAGALFAASVGVSVSELVALMAKGRSITDYFFDWLNAVLLAALIYGPSSFARGVAEMDGFMPSKLPVVTLATNDAHRWRLIGPVGDQLLLMVPETDAEKRLFRLVEATSIASIASASSASHAQETKADLVPSLRVKRPAPASAEPSLK